MLKGKFKGKLPKILLFERSRTRNALIFSVHCGSLPWILL
uniref:Uncharacterized protein MANES_14G137000 n=1 Tax=Rhizophora mucronata TaxID=61149 RepID=A0A2P2PFP2_RHIMU